MTTNSFTPGPWKFDGNCAGYIDADGVDGHIARVYAVADAKLVAAAPEMLAALQEISNMYQRAWDCVNGDLLMMSTSIPRFEAAHKAVRIAISKAIADGEDPLLDGDDF